MESAPGNAMAPLKSARKPGDLRAIRRKLWGAILWAEETLERADSPDLRLRAIHALSQAAGQYAKLLELSDLETRLRALEGWMSEAPHAVHDTP